MAPCCKDDTLVKCGSSAKRPMSWVPQDLRVLGVSSVLFVCWLANVLSFVAETPFGFFCFLSLFSGSARISEDHLWLYLNLSL